MSDMQVFYETEIAVDPNTPYAQLAQATTADILASDFEDWWVW
jgi:hypothetical protein